MGVGDEAEPKDMLGLTFKKVTNEGNKILRFEGDRTFEFFHEQDCCEDVEIADITGDLSDLEGSPILGATEEISTADEVENEGTCTWTFYKFKTLKGYVTVRWVGTSNGYYSESVSMLETGVPSAIQ